MTPLLTGVFASQISGHLSTPDSGAMFPIAMVNVGSAGASTITFSSIPDTYKHLQIRATELNSAADDSIYIRFNGDTGSNYAWHQLYGNGSTAAAGGAGTQTRGYIGTGAASTSASYTGTFVTDILDYVNTNKYKTVRSLTGGDANGSGFIKMQSVLWQSTSAISSIVLALDNGSFNQYSQISLYGIKG